MVKGFWQNRTMDILGKSLDTTSLRHKAISNNISNINTPNYKRQLVSFEQELANYLDDKDSKKSLRTTHPKHISLGEGEYKNIYPVVEMDSTSLRTDGNNVDIDLELAVLAENTVKFNVLSQSISKKFSMLSSVIRGGR
ncbi:MAG: flagellar basal body rod protein FlgB [Bacillota bacterium]